LHANLLWLYNNRMDDSLTKENLEEIMRLKGEVRGMAVRNHADFILKEKGEKGLKELEQKMEELGYPIDQGKIQQWEFYPIGLEIVELLAIKNLFEFGEEKFKEIGSFDAKVSFILRVFFKYFGSPSRLSIQAQNIWKKYYTIGEVKARELNEKEGHAILTVEKFKLHPIHCLHLQGYFSGVLKMAVGKNIASKETKCPFRGDEYHEFSFTW